MRRRFLFAALLLVQLVPAFSQEGGGEASSPGKIAAGADSYLVPQTIFVGDKGQLVTPLGQIFLAAAPFVNTAPETIPQGENLVIRRVELEHRNGSARLLIDFIPYAPGTLNFPPVVISFPGTEPQTITGLSAQVASILDPQEASLSDPAPPLAVPGTGLIVYGTSAAILLVLLAAAGAGIWGRTHFAAYRERFRRRRLLRAMDRYLRWLRTGEAAESSSPGELFSKLSAEFREFLTLFTGINCRVLTPSEFSEVKVLSSKREEVKSKKDEKGAASTSLPLTSYFLPFTSSLLSGTYLSDLFHRWENVRFSGRSVGQEDLSAVLDEVKVFIVALDTAERAAS
jgi:hypothetical protein